MIAIIGEFREKIKCDITPYDRLSDAKTAIRWIRLNAKELDVNPYQIVASGGSSGGYIAACTGMIKKFDEIYENKEISSVPNALVLFNPVINAYQLHAFKSNKYKAIDASPVHNIANNLPPTIILHGTEDRAIPYKTIVGFAREMKKAGNRCEVILYEGKSHGFFNYNADPQSYVETVTVIDKFLISLDYLQGSPTVRKRRFAGFFLIQWNFMKILFKFLRLFKIIKNWLS